MTYTEITIGAIAFLGMIYGGGIENKALEVVCLTILMVIGLHSAYLLREEDFDDVD